jgi:DNA-binding IclR family transcriptional regulator
MVVLTLRHKATVGPGDWEYASTLAHGLSVLEAFRLGEPLLSNKELSRRTGLSKASISRMTSTLMTIGLLEFDERQKRYRLGATILSLGYPLLAATQIRQYARPAMKELAEYVNGSVSLGIRDRSRMVYLETVRGHEALQFRPEIGLAIPLLASAMGRAWLAGASQAERIEALRDTRLQDRAQWRSYAARAKAEVSCFATRGYCISRDWQADVHAIGVPLRRRIEGEQIVFNCGIPVARLTSKQLERDYAPRLMQLVERFESQVGAT